MKIAFVYDRVNKIGGAERVLVSLHKMWPHAPLYTSIYKKKSASWADIFTIKSSFLQKISFLPHEILPNLMPRAFKSFNFNLFDIVVSISSAEGKYVNVVEPRIHVNYCLTPTRYLWSGYFDYLSNPGFGKFNFLIKFWFIILSPLMRMSDFQEAQKINEFVAISEEVASRIKKYYLKESKVIYPPVAIRGIGEIGGEKTNIEERNYYLIVSRLVPYKEIDLAIRVFNRLPDQKLVIVGTGSEESQLRKMSKKNIFFKGRVDDSELNSYYQNCRALIFPGIEDFGLTSLEAQLFGKPVFCRKKGGTSETIIIGKTGEVFEKEEELLQLVKNFDRNKYSKIDFHNNISRFSENRFMTEFSGYIDSIWKNKTSE